MSKKKTTKKAATKRTPTTKPVECWAPVYADDGSFVLGMGTTGKKKPDDFFGSFTGRKTTYIRVRISPIKASKR